MAADDLLISPDFVIPMTIEYKTLVSNFENGAEQRRQKWANPLHKWKLEFNNRTQTEFETIKTLFNAQKGQAIVFLWTNPLDSTQYTVRFASDSIEPKLINPGIYSFSFDVIQVK